jgi:hypothetical protein
MGNLIHNSGIIATFSFIVLFASCNNQSSSNKENSPENGELNNTFIEQSEAAELSQEQNYEQEKEKLISEGWQEEGIQNGQLPSCYNFNPKTGEVNNYLEVYVGSGTDVVIKVMNSKTDNCVRYVFINSGSTYSIKNIPEGKYYLKIAYGKNWLSKVENGQCIGKFLRNPMYEKGEDIMDFNVVHLTDSYKIPSFELKLDVISNGISNSFSSQNISESEFNK